MRTREGAPRRTADEPQQSTRTTTHRTTGALPAHRSGVSTPTHRRWKRRPSKLVTLASDALMFAIWFVIVSVVIGAMCAALWVVAP